VLVASHSCINLGHDLPESRPMMNEKDPAIGGRCAQDDPVSMASTSARPDG